MFTTLLCVRLTGEERSGLVKYACSKGTKPSLVLRALVRRLLAAVESRNTVSKSADNPTV